MCGIAGIVSNHSHSFADHLSRMMNRIKHRGPDGEGIFFYDTCALGHRRLSIVDLTTGNQPMLSPSGKTAIIFNGEIYGYKEIKNSLKDYPFITTSDTEVMLALYEKYGNGFLKYLPGMFAFAIWNDEKKELFCARDRFGEKPFYYATSVNNEFVFASEIKALLASGLIQPVLDRSALKHFLKHLYVHPHQTIFKNIFTLPPAHSLLLKDGKIFVDKYWNLPDTNEKINLNEAEERFRNLFSSAVEKQLVADVPVGAFLSGGIDSSSVVAFAGEKKRGIHTFSFAFEEGANELHYAKIIAEKFQTHHTELEDKHEDIANLLLQMQEIYDEPFADSSNIPTFLISKYASQFHKVVLTGDGGDELLGGYSIWYRALLNDDKKKLQENFIKAVAKKLLSHSEKHADPFIEKNYSLFAKQHLNQNVFFTEEELNELGLTDIESFTAAASYNSNTVDDAMRMDIENYMPGDILVKTDRASMANGLELRAPFLDVDFASFCISLPYTLKLNDEKDKLILKRALTDMLPEEILHRKKQGFGAPVDRWLQLKSVSALKAKMLGNAHSKIYSLLSPEKIKYIAAQNTYQTWILLVLSLWMEKHEFSFE